jgi:protein-S-isoprenylcysteine O-methyltransferase Ste14
MDSLYRNRLLIRCGNFLFRYRNVVFPLVIIPVIVIVTPLSPGEDFELDRWIDLPMLAVGVIGEALRVLVVGYDYIKRGGVDKRVFAERLVTRGVFAHSRNPLYVGNALILLSLLLMADNLWGYVIGGPFFVLSYVALVAAEEDYLRHKFGAEYEDYCRQVNRWIPNFADFRKSIEGMAFDWRRVIVKEYSSVFCWILGILAIELNEAVRSADFDQD